MFNVDGGNDSNTPISELEIMIEEWFGSEGDDRDINLEFYAKADAPATVATDGSGDLQLVYDGDADDSKSGSWLTADLIDFYSVKAGNGYAFYWVDGSVSGEWSTEHRYNKGISHLSAWVDVPDDDGQTATYNFSGQRIAPCKTRRSSTYPFRIRYGTIYGVPEITGSLVPGILPGRPMPG